jgi:hypothetical protein
MNNFLFTFLGLALACCFFEMPAEEFFFREQSDVGTLSHQIRCLNIYKCFRRVWIWLLRIQLSLWEIVECVVMAGRLAIVLWSLVDVLAVFGSVEVFATALSAVLFSCQLVKMPLAIDAWVWQGALFFLVIVCLRVIVVTCLVLASFKSLGD